MVSDQKKRGRRPTAMTPTVCTKIAELMTAGLRHSEAARIAGVAPSTARKHKSRSRDYAEMLERAEAEFEADLVGQVRAAASKTWTAAAWFLERRWPSRYARPEVQVQLNQSTASAEDIVEGIGQFLAEAEKRHNPPGARDVDAPSEDDS